MIFITGDVHHKSLNNGENSYIRPYSEIQLAKEYLRIAYKYDLKITLFITGKCFTEETDQVSQLLSYNNLEIGGHTYNAFDPIWKYRLSKLINGSYWFTYKQQYFDVARTIEAAQELFGYQLKSWRNHNYEYNKHTPVILDRLGIKCWSDQTLLKNPSPFRLTHNLTSLPINITKDHSMLKHGYRTSQWFEKQTSKKKLFYNQLKNILFNRDGSQIQQDCLDGDAWFQLFKNNVMDLVNNKDVVVFNAHPSCMYLLDEFKTFERICKFLAGLKTLFAHQADQVIKDRVQQIPIYEHEYTEYSAPQIN